MVDPYVCGKKVSPHLSGCCTKDFNIGFLDIASASVRNFELRLACYIEGACGIMLPSDVHSVFWIALLFPCVDAVVFDTASKQLCALPQCAKKLRLVGVRECHGCLMQS